MGCTVFQHHKEAEQVVNIDRGGGGGRQGWVMVRFDKGGIREEFILK